MLLEEKDFINLVDILDKEELDTISDDLLEGINSDIDSRKDWLNDVETFLKLATQVREQKSFPWPKASNVKYPLLTIAALQFQARAYPALVGTPMPVKGKVIGKDENGDKKARAHRIAAHMSYQLLETLPNWEDDMDRLCFVTPIVGSTFKRVYKRRDKAYSYLLLPGDLIVDYYAPSLETASRKTEICSYTPNRIQEMISSGEWVEQTYEVEQNQEVSMEEPKSKIGLQKPSNDKAEPSIFYHCHCWLDLDKDDYQEPYIVTIQKSSGKIARIEPRYVEEDVEKTPDGKVISIKPQEEFIKYGFFPNPVSGVYDLGFGHLLGPTNEAVDTLINQLIDSGTLNNLPSGFLGRGIRLLGGEYRFGPGEWKMINSTGDDIKKNIFQIPVSPPSDVLFKLLQLLISSGQYIAAVSETMLGEQPGQNTPFSTTSTVLDQSLKVFSSIVKRMHRAFKQELKLLYKVNKLTVTQDQYITILDEKMEQQDGQVLASDYQGDDTDVIPASDPNMILDAQKMQKNQELFAMVQLGTVNPGVVTQRILEAGDHENIKELMTMPPPQPNFDQQIELKKLEIQEKTLMTESQLEGFKLQNQAAADQAGAQLKLAQGQLAQAQAMALGQEGKMEQLKAQYEIIMKQMEMKLAAMQGEMDMQLQQMKTATEVMKIEAMKRKAELDEQKAKSKKYNPKTGSVE